MLGKISSEEGGGHGRHSEPWLTQAKSAHNVMKEREALYVFMASGDIINSSSEKCIKSS